MTQRRAAFCPDCGTALDDRVVDGRERRYCLDCERVVWRNPVPTAAVAVVCDRGVLCGRRTVAPDPGTWTPPGGHLEHGEDPATGAARELREETGVAVDPDDLTLLDTLSVGGGGKHVISIGYVVPAAATTGTPTPGDETDAVAWLVPDSLPDDVTIKATHVERVRRAWRWWRR